MSYIARLATDPQHGPAYFYVPDVRDGFLLPPMFFITSNLVYPTSERAEYTYLVAMRRKAHYEASKSYATCKDHFRACYTHNLLACGCKFEFDNDFSCCAEYSGGWLRCPCKREGKAQYLLTFNNEFGPDSTPLVPRNNGYPFERYQDILSLLYDCRAQTQHPSDHDCINEKIKYYTRLAGEPVTSNTRPMKDGVL